MFVISTNLKINKKKTKKNRTSLSIFLNTTNFDLHNNLLIEALIKLTILEIIDQLGVEKVEFLFKGHRKNEYPTLLFPALELSLLTSVNVIIENIVYILNEINTKNYKIQDFHNLEFLIYTL